ncbi:MFS transporter [Nannocystaceae bacterium ST9]
MAFVDFLDELGSGVAPVSAAEVRDEWTLAYGSTGVVLLVVPLLLAILIESPLLLVSDRWSRAKVVPIGVALMGVFMLLAASAGSMWTLSLAFGGWAAMSGLACAQAQGALMDAFPDQRERWMTRWTLCGTLGDAATPLVILAVAALGFGWRGALAAAGLLHVGHALVLAWVGLPVHASTSEDDDEDDDGETLWARLRRGLADREIFVVFGSLFLRDQLGASMGELAIAFGVCAIGGVLGLVATDRVLHRVDPLGLLVGAGLACAVVFVGWLQVRELWLSVALLFVLGVLIAPLYPICAARAYAAKPGEPGLVAAVDQSFAWVGIAAPWLIGLAADRWGVVAAMALLLIQPLVVAWVGARRIGRSTHSDQDSAG